MGLAFELIDDRIYFHTAGDVHHTSGLSVLQQAFAAAQLQTDEKPELRWNLFFDIRESTENRDSSELRNIAEAIAATKAILSGKCVVIATDPLRFGTARMFAVFLESLGLSCEVFDDLNDAERWLGQPLSGEPPLSGGGLNSTQPAP